MSRKLKFRIWDKLTESFIYREDDNQQHFILDLNGNFHNLQNGSGGDEYVVQQYTGLNDKNGKEIYEGDILEWKGEFIAEVFFLQENAAFIIKSKKGGSAFMNENYVLNFQIIGNIFETKNYFNEIPQEVKNAAVFLGDYFKKQGIDNWTLYDVSSRK